MRATSCMNSEPAHTSTSLLASATMTPRRIAASVGARPAAPTIPAMTHSAGRSAASTSAAGPLAASMPGPGERLLQRGVSAGSATAAKRAPRRRACSARRAGCGWRSPPRRRTHRGCAAADRRCFARPSRSSRGSSRVASVYSAFVASAGLAAWAAGKRQRADRPGRCRWSHRHASTLAPRSRSATPLPGSPRAARRDDRAAHHAQG